MLAAYLAAPGHIELREVKKPSPARGELLIRVKAALTCGTDLKAYLRGHPMIPMPGPFGHEFSGVIAEAGTGVRKFKEGDAVMAVHTAPCGKCRYCKKGLPNLCEHIMDTKVLGAFAEYVLVPARIAKLNVFRKPDKLPFDTAALLEPLSCVVHGLGMIDIKKGNTALVVGSGPIGLLYASVLKYRGVRVAVTDINPSRLRKSKSVGADLYVMPEGILVAMNSLTDGVGFDLVVECTGRPEVWEASAGYLRRGGTLLLFGGCPKGTTVTYDTYRLHYDEITLKGSFHFAPEDVRTAYKILSGGRINSVPFLSGRYPLERIVEAFGLLSAGRGIKYVIT